MQSLVIKAASVLTFGLLCVGNAQAQIAVDVDIDVGAITILSSFTDIDITIPDTALAALLVASETNCTAGTLAVECDELEGTATATVTGTALDAALNIGPEVPAASFGAVNLTLSDVWAVRAIGGASTNTTVTATLGTNPTLSNGASILEVDAVVAAPATFADPGLATPQLGDVTLTLDFTATTSDGLHDDGADTGDSVYIIEVTAT